MVSGASCRCDVETVGTAGADRACVFPGDLGEFEQHEGHIDDIGEGEEAQFKRLEAIFWREVEMKEEQRKMGIL